MAQDVIDSLDTLRSGTIKAGIEFKGLTKTLTSAAASTEGAGKAWTTFSRLVSGTPLLSTQNKIRAYLSILAGFENRSNANMEAHKKESEALLKKIQGYEKVDAMMKKVMKSQKDLIKYGGEEDKLKAKGRKERKLTKKLEKESLALNAKVKNARKQGMISENILRRNRNTMTKKAIKKEEKAITKLNDEYIKNRDRLREINKELKNSKKRHKDITEIISNLDKEIGKSLVNSEAYQKVFQATGNEEKSMLRAIEFMESRNKLLDEERLALKKNAKIAYAFDNNRVKDAKKLAKIKAEDRGAGFFGKRMASFTGGLSERFSQKKDQLKAGSAVKKDAARANAKGVTDNLKSAKMLLAPLLLVTKSTKLIYTAFNPFSSGAIKFRAKMRKFTMSLQPIMSMVFKYLVMSMLAIAAFFVILIYLKRYYEILEEFGVIDDIKVLGIMVFDWLKVGWKMVSAFLNGDYEKALDYAGKFVDKGIDVLIKTGKILLEAGFLAMVAGFDLLMDAAYKFYKDPEFRRRVTDILMKVALVVVALIVIQFLIGLALSLAAAAALPILIGVAVLAALFTVGYWLNDNFDEKFQNVEDYINNFFYGLQHYAETIYNDSINFLIKTKDDIIFGFREMLDAVRQSLSIEMNKEKLLAGIEAAGGKLITLATSIRDLLSPSKKTRARYNKAKDSVFGDEGVFGTLGIKGRFAKGGTSHGGLSLVGEQGPELLQLNAGSKIYSNSQSKRMMGGSTNIFNITINAKDTSDAEMRRVAQQLGKMIGNKLNRQMPFGNLI